jgi:hypothetical protein
MPFLKSGSKSATASNFDHFRHGKRYAQTRRKFGKKRANRQMQAAVLSNQRRYKSKR